jgi:hypothetical protein
MHHAATGLMNDNDFVVLATALRAGASPAARMSAPRSVSI